MKHSYLALIPVVALLSFSGCTNAKSLLTPSAVRSEVGTGVTIGLLISPEATPGVTLARDVICNESKKTNATPVSIVADLEAANITNKAARIIIQGGIFTFERAYAMLGTNATDKVQPYIEALCEGFTDGLPSSDPGRRARIVLPPHLK